MRRLGLVALLVIAAMGAGAGWLDSQISRPYTGHHPPKVFVEIPHGTSHWGVAGILKKDDIIRNRLAFEIFSLWHIRHPLQAGEYLFDQPLNSKQTFWKIAQGKIFLHYVTIPEGWSMFDIAADLDHQGVCSIEAFLAAARDPAPISDIAPQAKSLEGFLFPSTYEFKRRTTCVQVAETMTSHFRSVWKELNPSGAATFPGGLNAAQAVTLASLVERETPRAEERPLVAGVFYNRLRLGTPLQCDPTVQYALQLAGHPELNVRPEDLRIDSPYNTYIHRGLPPGPIANPGEASLRAALNPAQTDYMYFVANDQGGHFFSKTLAEHNRNVARYRALLRGEAVAPDPVVKSSKHRGGK
ncbi:MAG TPA: endolytic transglycosylase MltG [Candidatus Acidoferrum sp.]|nr:endolytic transglycosylase MltG [Candidatus Acidoferrum sp.]